MKKAKLYDDEFAPAVLNALKKREILGRANLAQLVPLIYNLWTEAKTLEQTFQAERRNNPLLETTPPEAWIAAQIVPRIQELRSNVDVDDLLLSEAVQKYLGRRDTPGQTAEGELCRTIEPYIPAIKQLFIDLCNRRRGLRQILHLRPDSYSIRQAGSWRKPNTKREQIILHGIRGKWANPRIAKELDEAGLKPRSKDYPSYRDMLDVSPQCFYSLKNSVKKKYPGS